MEAGMLYDPRFEDTPITVAERRRLGKFNLRLRQQLVKLGIIAPPREVRSERDFTNVMTFDDYED